MKREIKKYVEIYENMPLETFAKSINSNIAELENNIGKKPTLEDLIYVTQLYEFIPICTTSLPLLHLTLESILPNDIFTPTVTIMGHINHGKSSLTERLTNQSICQKEAGNITQNISLYTFSQDKNKFTLIDTPGHRALNKMRSLIIPLSEIIILVIAANAGTQEETISIIEQTNHKNRIICLNKIDAPNLVNEDYIYHKCLQHGLSIDETPVVKVSSKQNLHIDKLINEVYNMIEKHKYKTDLYRHGLGYIIDAFIQTGKGRIIKILLKAGMCKIGDMFCLNGIVYTIGRMWLDNVLCKKDQYINAGNYIDIVCDAKCIMGDLFFIVNNKQLQHSICQLQLNTSAANINENKKFVIYISTLQQHNLLNNMLPANSIVKIYMNNNITKDDIIYAKENNIGMIIWYKITTQLQELLEEYSIKYLASPNILIGDIEIFLLEKKEVIKEDKILGTCQIKAIFDMKDTVLGNDVKTGEIILGKKCKITRNNVLIAHAVIKSLQHERENIEKAKMGLECGIILKDITYITKDKFEFMIGDIISCLE